MSIFDGLEKIAKVALVKVNAQSTIA